ncbi:hypothetical protein [Marinicella meishanensis]|uniref:hypothetical protein n=1 Tax=Marinicella meishanensis TaxID=2873263 RepID=UPI001CBE35F7|nr:hypothetical protein [Marinicella sp. NBU2979]
MIRNTLIFMAWVMASFAAEGQTPLSSEFTYQGELRSAGQPVNQTMDFEFELYDAAQGGTLVGSYLADDLPVNDGMFATPLDFGLGAFIGDHMWLEIHVRPGNSTGGYQQLLPRQIIQSSPYAIHAQFVGVDAVGQAELRDGSVSSAKVQAQAIGASQANLIEIQGRVTGTCPSNQYLTGINQDGSVNCAADQTGLTQVTGGDIVDGTVDTADLANFSITADKIQGGSINNSHINPSQIQNRINGTCPVGQYLQSVNQDGSVACASDQAGLTTVTSADIVDGTIQRADLTNAIINEDKLADGAVSANKIQASAVGSNQINSSQVQQRINGQCAPGHHLRTINQDGSLDCELLPVSQLNSVDVTDNIFVAVQSVLNSNGLPIIIYASYDMNGVPYLHLYQCHNANCTAGVQNMDQWLIGSLAGVGFSAAINPISNKLNVVYNENYTLKLLVCVTTDCTNHNVIDLNTDGSNPSLTHTSSGFPLISYYDFDNDDLRVFACFNSACTASNNYVVDSAGNTGNYSRIIWRAASNRALILYNADSNQILKVRDCTSTYCNTGNNRIVDNSTFIGNFQKGLALDPVTGRPVMIYQDLTNDVLKMAYCLDVVCASISTRDLVASGQAADLTFNQDNQPIITFLKQGDIDALHLIRCTEYRCNDFSSRVINDFPGARPTHSVIMNNEQKPLITFVSRDDDRIKNFMCADSVCSY